MNKILISILLITNLYANEILVELGIKTAGAITGLIMGATIKKVEDAFEDKQPSSTDQQKNNFSEQTKIKDNQALEDDQTLKTLNSYVHLQDNN